MKLSLYIILMFALLLLDAYINNILTTSLFVLCGIIGIAASLQDETNKETITNK